MKNGFGCAEVVDDDIDNVRMETLGDQDNMFLQSA
jgi:hypothetical protein